MLTYYGIVGALVVLAVIVWQAQRRRARAPQRTRTNGNVGTLRPQTLAILGKSAGEIQIWFRAAGVDVAILDQIPPVTLVEIVGAYLAIDARKLELVTTLVDGIGALPARSRALLIEAARASIVVRDAMRAGSLQLHDVGYVAAERTYEFSAYFVNDPLATTDTEPPELDALRAIAKAKQDAAGNPVDVVRVVFPDEAMARQEQGPLRAAGATVCFMHPDSGELVSLT